MLNLFVNILKINFSCVRCFLFALLRTEKFYRKCIESEANTCCRRISSETTENNFIIVFIALYFRGIKVLMTANSSNVSIPSWVIKFHWFSMEQDRQNSTSEHFFTYKIHLCSSHLIKRSNELKNSQNENFPDCLRKYCSNVEELPWNICVYRWATKQWMEFIMNKKKKILHENQDP